MRLISLCFLFLFAVPPSYSQSGTKQRVVLTPPAVRTDTPEHLASLLSKGETQVPKSRLTISPPIRWEGDYPPTCYVISSYLMERERSNSDVTHLVGHTNCVPSRDIKLSLATATSTNSH
jgi:hypothetical protein